MSNKIQIKPPSVISYVRHLAHALYQDRVELREERPMDNYFDDSGVSHNIFAPLQRWAEIGGIASPRAAAILKDFLDEFAVVTAERDMLKTTLRQIAETAIKAGEV